jgi:hypothetical protein
MELQKTEYYTLTLELDEAVIFAELIKKVEDETKKAGYRGLRLTKDEKEIMNKLAEIFVNEKK